MAFQIPTDLASLDNDALSAAVEEAIAAFAPLGEISDDEVTEEQVAEMESLSAFVQSANSESANREAASAERANKLATIRESMASKPEAKEEADEEVVVEEPAVDEAPVVDEVIEEVPAPVIVDEEIVEEEEEDTVSKESALVAGGAKTSLTDRAARNSKTEDVAPVAKLSSITASANVPNVSAGQAFETLADASDVLLSNLKSYGNITQPGVKTRNGGLLLKPAPKAFSQNDFLGRDSEMLMAASAESRLSGGSLVAAGGWGAPSEQSLDFCSIETTEGLLDLPEVTVTRGGLNYTKGPDFAAVLASATGFWDMTEAVAEAGTEQKTALRPEVPGFIDARLDAVGVMIEAGLLLRNGWAELIQRYAELALVAHAHKVSAKSLREIKANTGAAISVPNGFGNALDILSILDVVAAGERQRNAMALNATLESIIPLWVKPAIRAALANRDGLDFISVTDAQIDSFFTSRKIRVQWVYTEQQLDVTTSGIATKYPDFIDVVMYPAGTYVRGVTDVISLDTIYDSTNLKKNDYVHLFVEQGTKVVNPCFTGRQIRVPLFVNGRTSAQDIVNNFGVAPTP